MDNKIQYGEVDLIDGEINQLDVEVSVAIWLRGDLAQFVTNKRKEMSISASHYVEHLILKEKSKFNDGV